MRCTRVLVLLTTLLCGACASDEPVLSGVPQPTPSGGPLLLSGDGDPQGPTAGGSEQPTVYARAEGVLVDVRFLAGKSYDEVRDVVADQLGALQSSGDVPGDGGKELIFERATLRLADGRIIRVRVPIEPPLRRTAALAVTGFPPASGRYVTLHREYRLNHEWGFRRIRLMRENRSSELINVVDAWLRVPGERGP